MEQEFSERLKRYRKERNLTQPMPVLFAALVVLAVIYLLAAGMTMQENEQSGGE